MTEEAPTPKKTFKDALVMMSENITDEDESKKVLEEVEQQEAEREKEEREKAKTAAKVIIATETEAKLPEFAGLVEIPVDLKVPRAKTVHLLYFKPEWTDKPEAGARTCVMWNLTVADEKLARGRTRGDNMRYLEEAAKQCVRAIDGQRVDWTKGLSSNIETWWNEIGAKCRNVVTGIYHKNHTLTQTEQIDFFLHCYAVRTAVSG